MALQTQLANFIERETTRADQATLGRLESDGSYTVDAPGKDGYVYVTYGGTEGFGGVVGIARNFKGAPPKLPVFVRGQKNVAKVVSNNNARTAFYNPNSNNFAFNVAKHTHGVGSGMTDPVQANRFVPGLVRPFKDAGAFGLKVYVEPTQYEYQNTLTWFPGNSIDLTSFIPGVANKQAWVVVGIDPATNLPIAKSDVTYSAVTAMNPSMLDGFDFLGNTPLGAVILRNGQTSINTFKDFTDLRVFATGNGAVKTRTVETKTSSDTLIASDDVILIDATGGNVVITLPAVADSNGKEYTIKRIDASANTATVDGDGGETIDDETTKDLDQYSSMQIVCDGSEWWII